MSVETTESLHKPLRCNNCPGLSLRPRAKKPIRLRPSRKCRTPKHSALIPMLHQPARKGHGSLLLSFHRLTICMVENSQQRARSGNFKKCPYSPYRRYLSFCFAHSKSPLIFQTILLSRRCFNGWRNAKLMGSSIISREPMKLIVELFISIFLVFSVATPTCST